ncbi:MAG: hypothetical protein IK088_04600, partial [Lachnospiraceae bacterium]|nr:hypothetical protein [Lachnospiraceae bacterium]
MGNTSQKEAFQKRLLLFLFKAVYLIICVSTFFIFWLVFRYGDLDFEIIPAFRYDLFTAVAYAILLVFLNRTYNNYLFGYRRIRNLIFTQLIAQFFSLFIIYAAVSLFWMKFYNAWPLLLVIPCDLLINTIWSLLGNRIFFALYPKIPAVLIYRNEVDKEHFGEIKGKPMERMFQIEEEIQYDGDFQGISSRLKGFDAIFVAGVNSSCRNGLLKYCKEEGIVGYFLPHVGDVLMRSANHIQAFDSPVLCVERKILNPEYAFIKRAFDIFFALVLIVLTSPIMLVTALVIK